MIEIIPEKPFIISAIDIGTNSIHMVIASVDNEGNLNTISSDKEMVRLGSSSGDMKHIEQDAISRAVSTLSAFKRISENYNAPIRAIATSAVREALNKEEFIEVVKEKTGVDVEVVSGNEEARLISTGVIHALPIYNKKTFIMDIGGGSTETIIFENGENLSLNSVKIGAIRLTKKFFENTTNRKQAIQNCLDFIKGEWVPILKKVKDIGFDTAIGTSGTITNIVSMAYLLKNTTLPEIYNGITVSSTSIKIIINKLKNAKSVDEIKQINGIDVARADIILAGSLIIEFAIDYLNIKSFTLSSFALREGIVFDTYRHHKAIEKFHHLSELRYQTIQNVCKKYKVELKHARHVKSICVQLFKGLQELHKLGEEELELLEAAALLHDCGFYISHDSHHKHSYYLIKNCIMPGFTNNEAEIIANIARYHRKSLPKKKHENYASLSVKDQNTIWILGGILRIAEGIDRRQILAVKAIKLKIDGNMILINLIPNDPILNYPDIELWGANRRKNMLEEKLLKIIKIEISK